MYFDSDNKMYYESKSTFCLYLSGNRIVKKKLAFHYFSVCLPSSKFIFFCRAVQNKISAKTCLRRIEFWREFSNSHLRGHSPLQKRRRIENISRSHQRVENISLSHQRVLNISSFSSLFILPLFLSLSLSLSSPSLSLIGV